MRGLAAAVAGLIGVLVIPTAPVAGATDVCAPPPVWDDRPPLPTGDIADRMDDPGYQETRARLDRNRSSARAYAQEHPDEFAGMFVDAFAGLVYVAFTENRPEHRAALRAMAADPDAIRVIAADHSLANLHAVQAQVTEDMATLRRRGIRVSAVGPDVRVNRVSVMVVELDHETKDEFCRHYGADMFVFEEGALRAVAAPRSDVVPSPEGPADPVGSSGSPDHSEGGRWTPIVVGSVLVTATTLILRRRRRREAERDVAGA